MRVKVGDRWFPVQPGQPIAVELTAKDRENIANMLPEATRYGCFDNDEPMSRDAKLTWLGD